MNSSIQKLVESFSKFPGIGQRVATRFAYYLAKISEAEFNEFIFRLQELRKKIKLCSFCFNIYESTEEEKFCPICSDKTRDKTVICLVEKKADLESIEKTKKYKGLYFILGGTVSLTKETKNIRISELEKRIEKLKSLKEIIIATNFTPEGEATGLYIERKIKSPGIKITRLSRGMPSGGEIEYADSETIENSLLKRN